MSTELSDVIGVEKRILAEIESGLSAYASLIGWGEDARKKQGIRVAYASAPITTGPRMYAAFLAEKVTSADELKKANPSLAREVFEANIRDGEFFAAALRETKKYDYVICPSTFFSKGWTQEHYMSLWDQVIERFATAIHFFEGWQFSNGCVEEFLLGLRYEKELYDCVSDTKLNPKDGLKSVEAAIEDISKIPADIKPIYNSFRRAGLVVYSRGKDSCKV